VSVGEPDCSGWAAPSAAAGFGDEPASVGSAGGPDCCGAAGRVGCSGAVGGFFGAAALSVGGAVGVAAAFGLAWSACFWPSVGEVFGGSAGLLGFSVDGAAGESAGVSAFGSGAGAFSDGFDAALLPGGCFWPARRDEASNHERAPGLPFGSPGSGSWGAGGMYASNRERSDGSYVGRIGGWRGPVEDLSAAGLAGLAAEADEEADDWAGAGGCPGLG
jgi:hypothetical protein